MLVRRTLIVIATLVGHTTGAWAIDLVRLPEEPGFSGFINAGAAANRTASNLVAGTRLGDVSHAQVESLTGGPDAKSSTLGLFNLDLRYTLADNRTQVFAGTGLEDLIRYDFTTRVGVRREFDDAGLLGLSWLFPAVPTEVWRDPYLTGTPRAVTERKSTGARVTWNRVLGSRAHLQLTHRTIEIHDERSGESLALTPRQRAALGRDGELGTVEVAYALPLSRRHVFLPGIAFSDADLDGEALAHERRRLQLTYVFAADPVRLVVNAAHVDADYDARDPVFGRTRDDDQRGLAATFFYRAPFGRQNWSGVVNAADYESDSNIDFYDARVQLLSLSLLFRF